MIKINSEIKDGWLWDKACKVSLVLEPEKTIEINDVTKVQVDLDKKHKDTGHVCIEYQLLNSLVHEIYLMDVEIVGLVITGKVVNAYEVCYSLHEITETYFGNMKIRSYSSEFASKDNTDTFRILIEGEING